MTPNETKLNEAELWELLKDKEDAPRTAGKKSGQSKKNAPKADENGGKAKTVITDKRKKALVWYLVGLFDIAFVVVLVSLLMRGVTTPGGSTNPSGESAVQIQELYDRINELEDENSTLLQENEALTKENEALADEVENQQLMMDGLNTMIDELTESLEYVEGSALYTDENAEKLARTMAAYQTLVRAQNAFIDYDEAVLEEAMKDLEDDLDLLSQEAMNAYFMVIEYMEQPTLGQE